eukprot:1601880-Pleurochrysis_carterae.AAC.7
MLEQYTHRLKSGALTSPRRGKNYKKGSKRWVADAVRVAKLLREHGRELRRRLRRPSRQLTFARRAR